MSKCLALSLCLLLMATAVVIPAPTKAVNYGMDTDLSNVDASFKGEDSDDESGVSVEIVGDVNGDGIDDMLIGAHEDEDGGYWAGQSYLIFGMPAGYWLWQMDRYLTSANATFWGEDSYDLSGSSVAGDRKAHV